jgi:hypothetical protein
MQLHTSYYGTLKLEAIFASQATRISMQSNTTLPTEYQKLNGAFFPIQITGKQMLYINEPV